MKLTKDLANEYRFMLSQFSSPVKFEPVLHKIWMRPSSATQNFENRIVDSDEEAHEI